MAGYAKVTAAVLLILLMACSVDPPSEPNQPAPEQPGTVQPTTRSASPKPPPITYGLPNEPASIQGPARVPDGTPAVFTVSGFGFGEVVFIRFQNNPVPVQTLYADAMGKLTFSHGVKSAPGTKVTVTATGQKSNRTATFSYTLT